METVSIKAALGAGWRAFKRRPWYLLGLMLAFVGIFAFSIGNAVVSAMAYIAYGGYLVMMLRHLRGEHVVFDDMFSLDNRWVSFAFLGLIKMILIILGFICFIVPGVYLSIRWMFAELLVLEDGLRPLEALKASSSLTEGHRGKLFGFMLVGILLMLLATPFIIIGWLVVSLVLTFAALSIYDTLRQKSANETVHISAGE